MRIHPKDKTDDLLEHILGINRECFSGVQRAPDAEVARMFRNHGVFVIIKDGGVLGFAICESRGSEVHLWSLAIRPEYRGHNLGGYLLDEAWQYYGTIGGYYVMTLDVHVDNVAAIHLYERLGFRKVSVLKRWFLHDGDGVRMTKELI
jgi:[ribosomal protein S18]-alanine N-acetyltransferase